MKQCSLCPPSRPHMLCIWCKLQQFRDREERLYKPGKLEEILAEHLGFSYLGREDAARVVAIAKAIREFYDGEQSSVTEEPSVKSPRSKSTT